MTTKQATKQTPAQKKTTYRKPTPEQSKANRERAAAKRAKIASINARRNEAMYAIGHLVQTVKDGDELIERLKPLQQTLAELDAQMIEVKTPVPKGWIAKNGNYTTNVGRVDAEVHSDGNWTIYDTMIAAEIAYGQTANMRDALKIARFAAKMFAKQLSN